MSLAMTSRASSTVATGSVVPGTIGTPASPISSRARVLDPIASIAAAGGPMNVIPASSSRRGEGGVLGQEPVAGVDGLGARGVDHLHQLVDVQVRLGRRSRAEQVRFAATSHVLGLAVGLRVDGDRGDAELVERA